MLIAQFYNWDTNWVLIGFIGCGASKFKTSLVLVWVCVYPHISGLALFYSFHMYASTDARCAVSAAISSKVLDMNVIYLHWETMFVLRDIENICQSRNRYLILYMRLIVRFLEDNNV